MRRQHPRGEYQRQAQRDDNRQSGQQAESGEGLDARSVKLGAAPLPQACCTGKRGHVLEFKARLPAQPDLVVGDESIEVSAAQL